MGRGDIGPGIGRASRAILVVSAVGAIAALSFLATGRLAFGVGAAVSAALAFGTISLAERSGRAALAAGQPVRAGVLAGALMGLRFLGVALLMVVAFVAPRLVDMWGVVAGMVAADAVLLLSEGRRALTVA
jgi:hypothetical protein